MSPSQAMVLPLSAKSSRAATALTHYLDLMNITAQQFFAAWVATVHEMRPALVENWRKARAFTALIKSSDDCVIRRIADKVGLKCYPHDYYSVDSVLYQQGDLVPEIPEGSTWLRALSVAFEHENYIDSGLYKEVSHLLILNADLRVLVTYPGASGLEDSELIFARSIIRDARHEKKISDEENFLLIIGREEGFEWEGYVYKQEKWKKISER